MAQETFTFQTEVERLLEIVAHSLYSHKEIFLRELISNASDACDRLRYAALTEAHLTAGDTDFKIRIVVDRDARTLSVVDNGIGMNRDDLLETLGTIARSGTQAFLAKLSGDAKKDTSLIGQFGVGFYSAFMVADHVDVITRKAGEEHAWRWSSDGRGQFTIDGAERPSRGTTVTVHLKADEDEFLETMRLSGIVKKYSDHIGFPILLGEGEKAETLNAGSSLWMRPKKDITESQYKEFYRHVGHGFDDPWLTLHNTVEGVVSYTSLLFIPEQAPFDLFDAERKGRVRLYVRKVFITDDCEGLIPPYLRFLRGVVDSEDLPLNISRETFQHDPRLAKIRSGLCKRVFDELAKKAEEAPSEYETFWNAFGAVLKEGLYEDFENRERILPLCRFRSSAGSELTSLDGYIGRMKPGQDAIYTLAGDDVEALKRSPQLEGFRAKGVEVLLLTDPIDEFWIPSVRTYKDKPFKSAAAADAQLDTIEADTKAAEPTSEPPDGLEQMLGRLKDVLKDAVKDVRASKRLTESAVCLVAGEGDLDMHLERLLRRHRQLEGDGATPRVLEINPTHPLIRRLAAVAADSPEAIFADAAFLLLDQARIQEGERVSDAQAFSRRLAACLERSLTA
ncbi:Chaperone protein HtpG [Candidatus Defluviicoccus seviourii]|uniref:Chaperone protein HtpG n=1 Tax=Candidatus Defluviicoccus seviourii TaxID=2565273 RepID=A0A564WI09_9PROT|nr:Chaperone protein HtpG [Candidatus Defluviicoccus seviourii]